MISLSVDGGGYSVKAALGDVLSFRTPVTTRQVLDQYVSDEICNIKKGMGLSTEKLIFLPRCPSEDRCRKIMKAWFLTIGN